MSTRAVAAKAAKKTAQSDASSSSGGDFALSLGTVAFFTAYTIGQNVAATPIDGKLATASYYSECSYVLPGVVTSL